MDFSSLVLPPSTPLEWRLPALHRLLAQLHPIDTLVCGTAYKTLDDIGVAQILYKLTSTKPKDFFLLELSAFYTNKLIDRCTDDRLAAELRFAYECFLLGVIKADADCGLHDKTLAVMVDGCSERNAPLWADVIRQVCMRASPTIENLLFVDGMTNACYPLRVGQDKENYERWTTLRRGLFDCLRLPEIILRMPRLSALQVPNFEALLGDARPQSRGSELQWQYELGAAWAQFVRPDEQLDKAQQLQFLEVDEIDLNLLPRSVVFAQNFFCDVKVFRFQTAVPIEARELWQPYSYFQREKLTRLRALMPNVQFQNIFPPAMFFLHSNVRVEDYVNGTKMLRRGIDCPGGEGREDEKYLTNIDLPNTTVWLFMHPLLLKGEVEYKDVLLLSSDRSSRRYFRTRLDPGTVASFVCFLVTCGIAFTMHSQSNRLIMEGASTAWHWEKVRKILFNFCWNSDADTKQCRFVLRVTDGDYNGSKDSQRSCNCGVQGAEHVCLAAVNDLMKTWQRQAKNCERNRANFFRCLNISNFHVDLVLQKRENETWIGFEERIEHTACAAKLMAQQQRTAYEQCRQGDERCVMLLFSRLRVVVKHSSN